MRTFLSSTLSVLALAAFFGPISAEAQSYGSLGNDPVRSHTYLGDRPIDPRGGGTVCYRSVTGPKCTPVSKIIARRAVTKKRWATRNCR